ncbi:MAG TPA: restriction endonuclease subunit S [Sulfuriferula sp.]|nr:restriction endonuclease subunit S [Sulfuriferula sp.]
MSEWRYQTLDEHIRRGNIELGRGDVISKIDIEKYPGPYPIYSSSAQGDGKFGEYGKFMFDEELISWSVDGGGNFFYRPKHQFSVTNVSGYLRIKTKELGYRFLYYSLALQHRDISFDYTTKAHPSVIKKLYSVPSIPKTEQDRIAEILSTLDEAIEQTEALIAKHQQIKAGLMHDLFTRGVTPDGHLRLTREQAPDLYNESPLGWIPKEWDACPIESLLDRIIDYRGKTPTKTIEGIPLITAKNIRMGYIAPEPREFIAERDYPTWMTRGIPANTDVVFTTEAPLGNVAQIGTSEKVAFAQRVIILQPGARVCPDFLRLLLMAEPFQHSVFRFSSGTTALGVKQSEFRKVMVACPVLREEQQFISDKLQALEAYEAMEASRMQKLRQQKNGLMHDLLTGCVRVPLAKTKVVSTMAHAPSDLEPNT